MKKDERIRIFCQEIWQWYAVHKRTLPWRDIKEKDVNHKAYLVLVSEVMLQQTQVPRVIILYKKFIQQFPRIEDLAKASNREILIAWRGLGYNNRALRLRDSARRLTPACPAGRPDPSPKRRGEKAVFPRSMEDLTKLPGVGHYTAAAIRNFAFGIPTQCIDVNIRRILHRFFVGPENTDGTWRKDDQYLLKIAEKVLEAGIILGVRGVGKVRQVRKSVSPALPTILTTPTFSASDWHAALMDFGSLVCTKNNPKWDLMSNKMKSICMAYGKEIKRTKKVNKKEPGREIAGRFVPQRIIRGRIVEVLRDHPKGLSLDEIGRRVVIDWTLGDHAEWLSSILITLMKDAVLETKSNRFYLQR